MDRAIVRWIGASEYCQSLIRRDEPDEAQSVRSQYRMLRYLHGVGGSGHRHTTKGSPYRCKPAGGGVGIHNADRSSHDSQRCQVPVADMRVGLRRLNDLARQERLAKAS